MADSEKENLTTDSKKKTTALDEDFGNDFLSFWGSSKKGKDDIDFDMEAAPQNKKKSFNFDKLDDFELDRDLDKLSSFKIDMPELDFSSPAMNNAKPTEKPIRKKDSKNEKFSFNFDFNELDRFDLDSSPAEDKKKPSKHADSTDYSLKHVRNQDSKSKSDTSTDMFKDQENTKPQNADITASSRPESLLAACNIDDARPSVSQHLEHHDASSHEVKTSTAKQITVADENNDGTHGKGHREQTQETRFIRTNVERTTQDFILESASGDCSAKEDNLQVQTSPDSLDDVRAASAKGQDDSMRTVDSSQSRNSSPTKSYSTRYCPETSMIKSPNASGDNQKICKWNQNKVTGGKKALGESTQGQMGFQNVALSDFSQNTANKMNNPEVKINSGTKFILSPLRRDSRAVYPKSLNDKLAASLQLNSLNKSAENAIWKTSSATKREFDNVHSNKLKSSNICLVKENRESSRNHEQAETSKVGISKSHGEDSKGISDTSRSEKDDNQSNTSSFLLKTSNLRQSTAASTAQTNHHFVSGTSSIRCSKNVPVETSDTSLKDKRTRGSRLTISSMKNVNITTPNSAAPKEAKSVSFSERSLVFPLTTASKTASSVSKEKPTSINLFIKRKTSEESTADPDNSKPLKRSTESATGRKPFEVSQKVEREAVPVTENLVPVFNDNCTEDLASNGALKLRSLTESEAPLQKQKDGKVQKAKALNGTYSAKEITGVEENRKETRTREGYKEQPKGAYLTKPCVERLPLHFVSGDCSAQEDLPQTKTASLNAAKSNSAGEQDDMRTVESSQSRSTSPVNSYNSRCCREPSLMKSQNASEAFQEHHQGNQNEFTGGKELSSELDQYNIETQSASSTDFSEKITHRMNNTGDIDNQSMHTVVIPSPLQRVGKQNHEAQTQKVGILKLYEKGSAEGISALSRGQKSDAFRFQLKTSGLLQQTVTGHTAKSTTPNSASNIAYIKSSMFVPIEMNGSSSIKKFSSKTQNSAITKEAKLARFDESNSEFPLKTPLKMSNSITQKSPSLSAPLKRKTYEDSTDDPTNSNPLKRVMGSPIGRKPLEVTPETERAPAPVTVNLEASHPDNCRGSAEDLISDVEAVAPMEKDEIVEKAEAYSKELDNMCETLTKKHEEARELLVRAIVNHNALLMLNHPLLKEKIRNLHKFATSLQLTYSFYR